MKRSIHLIIYGFIGVMLLMIAVIAYSLMSAERVSTSLQDVHLLQNKKSNLIFKMREGQLHRIVILRNLYILDDPFEIDKERMQFYSYARDVNDARNELMTLALFPSELKALDNFMIAAKETGPIHHLIIDEILAGTPKKDLSDLLKEVFLKQEKAMQALQFFQESLNIERKEELSLTIINNDQAKSYIFISTIIASILALFIVWYVVRVIAKQTKVIDDEHKKFRVLFDKNMDAVAILSANKVIEWNKNMESLFEVTEPNQLKAVELDQLSPLTQEDNYSSQALFQQKLVQASELDGSKFEWQFEKFDGSVFYAEVSLVHFKTNEGELQQVVIKDISERKKAEKIMHEQANYDHLTGLSNRALFLDNLKVSVSRANRFKHKFALLFIDLDRFKQVNDTMGHLAGDFILKEAASRLTKKVRKIDKVARLGGDEFTVILDNINNPSDAAIISEGIIKEVAKSYQIDNAEVNIGASIGITIYPDDAEDTQVLLSNADMAMYQAKQSGRNKHHFFTQELNLVSQVRHEIEQDLRAALEQNQLELYFQPIINVQSKKVVCAEALIRWNHPEKGVIPPLQFIPIAEELGLIKPLTQWVLEAACEHLVLLQKQDFNELCISINLPASEKLSGLSTSFVSQKMNEYGIAPERLVFEITESLLMEDTKSSILWLNSIRDLGIRVSIDDFGTGYSSLSYLKQFPIDTLKIDKSFIDDINHDNNDQCLVDAILAIAASLELGLVAEGVETLEQLNYFQNSDQICPLIQGYYFSKPLPFGEFEEYLRQ